MDATLYEALLHVHSVGRWIVLLLLLFAIFNSLIAGNRPFIRTDARAGLLLVIFADLMLLIGFALWYYGPNGYKLIENHGGMTSLMKDPLSRFFAAIRPPGHHATPDRGMGFCIFNNVAIAARYLQKKYGIARVLIVDWDYHHGNGTQDIFYNDGSVFYFSTHHYGAYPGTGSAAAMGAVDSVEPTEAASAPVWKALWPMMTPPIDASASA